MDHGRRSERDRPRRSADERRPRVPAPCEHRLREPEHGRLRPHRRALVHRPERDLRPPEPADGSDEGVPCAPRSRAVRHHGRPGRLRLLRVARRELPRPHRPPHGSRDRAPAADPRPGRAPRVGGLPRPHLGERVERGQGRAVRPAHAALARVAAPRRESAAVLGLRRRQRRRLADRLRRERDRPLRPDGRCASAASPSPAPTRPCGSSWAAAARSGARSRQWTSSWSSAPASPDPYGILTSAPNRGAVRPRFTLWHASTWRAEQEGVLR